MTHNTLADAVVLHYTAEDQQAFRLLAEAFQRLADEYQSDAIASAQSEAAQEANRQEYK